MSTFGGEAGMSVTDARFEELVNQALDTIPENLLRELSNIVMLIDDFDPDDPHILGLYRGVALTERTHDYGGVLPDTITIYRKPLLDMCSTEDELIAQVRITVIHEIGHHFGIDDDRLHELGWG